MERLVLHKRWLRCSLLHKLDAILKLALVGFLLAIRHPKAAAQIPYDAPFSQHGVLPTWETTANVFPVGKGQFSLRHATLGLTKKIQLSAETFRMALRAPNATIKVKLNSASNFRSALSAGLAVVLSGAADSYFRTTDATGRINNFIHSIFVLPIRWSLTIAPSSRFRMHYTVSALGSFTRSDLKNRLDIGTSFWGEVLLSKYAVAGFHFTANSAPIKTATGTFENTGIVQYGPSLRLVYHALFVRAAFLSSTQGSQKNWSLFYDLGLSF